MTDEVRALVARHLPGMDVRSVALLGGGLEHTAHEVNGDLVVRVSRDADPARRREATRREADLLAVVARWSTLPVPRPVFVDAEAGVLAYVKLPGRPLNLYPVVEPARLAPILGRFLTRLHDAPLDEVAEVAPRDVYPLADWRRDAERDLQEIGAWLPRAARGRVDAFLGRALPAEPEAVAFCHADLGSEHLLADARASTITGVIDWADAAITDPARDFALIYRDLGPEVCERTLAHYGGRWTAADRERVVFYARCALLEDIAYGLRTGARPYTEAGLAHLGRTFA